MNKGILLILSTLFLFASCDKENEIIEDLPCEENSSLDLITQRNFEMGFSTWSYGPDERDQAATYQFIESNADIYSEQIDDKIPWSAWMNDASLPADFTSQIENRISKRLDNHQLLLSVSLLNTDRSDLIEDYDGTVPDYTSLNDIKLKMRTIDIWNF